jgi:hypothetical protein
MIKPINFPKYRFLELLRESVGNSKFKILTVQLYAIKTGDDLLIQTSDESCYFCNFLNYTITGEIAVNFQGKGFSTISPKIINNILCI